MSDDLNQRRKRAMMAWLADSNPRTNGVSTLQAQPMIDRERVARAVAPEAWLKLDVIGGQRKGKTLDAGMREASLAAADAAIESVLEQLRELADQ